jgi:hypothetical protein
MVDDKHFNGRILRIQAQPELIPHGGRNFWSLSSFRVRSHSRADAGNYCRGSSSCQAITPG